MTSQFKAFAEDFGCRVSFVHQSNTLETFQFSIVISIEIISNMKKAAIRILSSLNIIILTNSKEGQLQLYFRHVLCIYYF